MVQTQCGATALQVFSEGQGTKFQSKPGDDECYQVCAIVLP